MKWSTNLFLVLQILDIVLTFFAIHFGLAIEGNPLGFTVRTLVFKLCVVLVVVLFMEKVNFGKLVYLLLAVPFLVVVWNIYVIATSIFLILK